MKFSWSLDLNGARFHNLPQCSIFIQLSSAESREQHGATREMVTLSSFRCQLLVSDIQLQCQFCFDISDMAMGQYLLIPFLVG